MNLIEFAFGLNPRTPGGSALLPQVQISGGNLVYQFEQPAGVSGIRYDAEWNTGLSGEWTRIASSVAAPEHYFSVPMGTTPRLFVRLVVSVP